MVFFVQIFLVHLIHTCFLYSCINSQSTDTWDGLGYGLKPYDGIYDSKNLLSRVLDLGPLVIKQGKRLRENTDVVFVDHVNQEKTTAQGFNEFTRVLKRELSIGGGFAGFKAKVGTHFKFESIRREDYFFSRFASMVERAHIRIRNPTLMNLQSLVIPEVANYLATRTPHEIFSVYGTHVTTGLVMGGMLELWSSSSKSRFSSKRDFSLSASASFKSFINGKGSLTNQERILAEKVETSEGLVVRGGTFVPGDQATQKWAQTTSINAQEIKFLKDGAVPIWNLIPNAAQAQRVRDHYQRIFGRESIFLKLFESQPLNNMPRVPHPEAQIIVPSGWKVISGGARVQFFGFGQLLTKSYPIIENGIPVGWKVQSKDHLRSDPGKIQAFAVAVYDPFDNWLVSVRSSTSARAPHPYTSAKVPAGYTLVGGGGNTLWGGLGNMLVENFPSSSTTWVASSKDHLKSDPATVIAYAIGMKSRQGIRLKTRRISNRAGPLPHPSGTVYATRGYSIIGGGAQISKGGLGNMLVNCIPSSDGKQFFASGKDHLEGDRQYITVYGIEVKGATFVKEIGDVLGLDPTAF